MRATIHSVLLGVSLVLTVGCRSIHNGANAKAAEASVNPTPCCNHMADTIHAVLWVQRSGEYRALCYQAYTLATHRLLSEVRTNQSQKPLAVILDIDETVLNNSPHQAQLIKNDTPYKPAKFKEWTAQAAATAVPGAAEFLAACVNQRVEIFYISNRGTDELAGTLSNLQKAGLPSADTNHVLLQIAKEGKQPRRSAILDKYEVIELIGDNLNDFASMFEKKAINERNALTDTLRNEFGRRFIVLPNPMYGDWESALYNYDFGISPVEQAGLRRHNLSGF